MEGGVSVREFASGKILRLGGTKAMENLSGGEQHG
jgi:hypothetical protein